MLVTKPSVIFPQPKSGILRSSSLYKPSHVHQQINTQLSCPGLSANNSVFG